LVVMSEDEPLYRRAHHITPERPPNRPKTLEISGFC